MESKLLEKTAKDVIEKLNRVNDGDLDRKIEKIMNLAKL